MMIVYLRDKIIVFNAILNFVCKIFAISYYFEQLGLEFYPNQERTSFK